MGGLEMRIEVRAAGIRILKEVLGNVQRCRIL